MFPLQILVCLYTILHQSSISTSLKLFSQKVLADVSTVRFSREYDGTLGMWSFEGNANQSHVAKTHFIYNGDLVDDDSILRHPWDFFLKHTSIASTVYPLLGLTSDNDPTYQKYLILQAKVARVDGFLVEWGYNGHSSDQFLRELIRSANNFKHGIRKFYVGVNWCDAWLKASLKNVSSEELIIAFHANTQYLLNTIFNQSSSLIHNGHPVIFLFGGGLSANEFYKFLQIPLNLPFDLKSPLWIGNYLNFALTSEQRTDWLHLINGTFGWAAHNYSRSPPSRIPNWDIFTTPEDTVIYQKNISKLIEPLLANGTWAFWAASVNPGFDNRGCAAWGRFLEYTPRHWNHRITYNQQWKYHLQHNTSANVIFIPTLNDYAEASVILPTSKFYFHTLLATERFSSLWKHVKSNAAGIKLPFDWFQSTKKLEFFKGISGIEVTRFSKLLNTSEVLLDHGLYFQARNLLNLVRDGINFIEKELKVKNDSVEIGQSGLYPSMVPVMLDGNFYVNKTSGPYFRLNESKALILRNNQFKGLLQFKYKQISKGFSTLKVFSSTNRQGDKPVDTHVYSHNPSNFYHVIGNFSEICSLQTVTSAQWYNATVELYKCNQSWNHNGPYESDVYFQTKNGEFVIKDIHMIFYVYS